MRLDDDFEENGGGIPVILMALAVSVFFLVVLGIVIAVNKDTLNPENNSGVVSNWIWATPAITPTPAQEMFEEKRVASDLDIWDMYPKVKEDKKQPTPTVTPKPTEAVTPSPTGEPDMDDGKHVKVELTDGTIEWIPIDDKMEKNTYDFTNLVDSAGKLRYVSDGKTSSYLGIDISRYQKDIDFNQIKDQGIDFVMIRVGARGYKTGTLTLDEYFEKNLNGALDAGIDVGLYFYSQAITVQEATDEANMVLNAIGDKKIKYPIAFDMEFVENDMSRIDTLSKDERTLIAATFVNLIYDKGYKPMIYGNKEWLLKRIDISKFTKSSVWLAQYDDKPDYPYAYDMWQYTTEGDVYGINGAVDMNICFVDYDAQ